MPNMHYCRFQNTLRDLRDCQNALDSGELADGELSDDEASAARRLIEVCGEILQDHTDQLDSQFGDA